MTGPRPGEGDPGRAVFDGVLADADAMLRRDGAPEPFAVWALAVIRRQVDRYRRYAALDGVMAAMDEDEARRA